MRRNKGSGFGGLEVACWPLVPKFSGSNPAEAVGFLRVNKNLSMSEGMDVVCCQVEVSATKCSLVQRSPTDCGASLSVIYKSCKNEDPYQISCD